MKLQIDTTEKVIKVEEQVNFGELVKVLNKLLSKGEWKTYKLETNTVINWNQYPTYPYNPFFYTIDYGTTSGITLTGDNISGDTTTINPNTPFTLTDGVTNIEA